MTTLLYVGSSLLRTFRSLKHGCIFISYSNSYILVTTAGQYCSMMAPVLTCRANLCLWPYRFEKSNFKLWPSDRNVTCVYFSLLIDICFTLIWLFVESWCSVYCLQSAAVVVMYSVSRGRWEWKSFGWPRASGGRPFVFELDEIRDLNVGFC